LAKKAEWMVKHVFAVYALIQKLLEYLNLTNA
jgi:hypothetical protein